MYTPNQKIPQRIIDIITTSCTILFGLFCFVYLYFTQSELLAEAQFAFSNGATSYSPIFGALMITVLLILVQFLTARLSKLNGRCYAVTYFPSFLMLAVLSSIDREVLTDFSFGNWAWILPVTLVVYALLVIVIKQVSFQFSSYDDENHTSKYLWPNYILLLIMMLWCGSMQNADDVFMYELKAEQYILDGKYEKAANVGKESLKTSARLNELRCFALAKQGMLGEMLFDYPQPYRSDGLILLSDTLPYERFTSMDICNDLGAKYGKSIKSTDSYLEKLIHVDSLNTKQIAGDYYLCNRLLNKDLNGFLAKLTTFYPISDSIPVTSLPRAYKEALVLEASAISNDSLLNFCDSLVLQSYLDYNNLLKEYDNETERFNYARRNFGNTYFFYKDFSDYSAFLSEYDR